MERECKRPYLETSSVVSEEHYFISPPSHESPLQPHSYCTEAMASRDACMYKAIPSRDAYMYDYMETKFESGMVAKDDITNSPSLNCNMWTTAQPYLHYSVDGVSYQPFTPHFPNSVVSPSVSSMMSQPPQADMGFYHSAPIQRSVPIITPSPPPSLCSPAVPVSRNTSGNPPLYQPRSPLQPQKYFSVCSTHGAISIHNSSYQ